MSLQPLQMTLLAEKDAAWCKQNIDYHANIAWGNSIENYDLDVLYRAVEGHLEMDDYRYVLNPYNTENKQYARRPAKLRNMNIILPIINLFLGERNRKNNEFQVIVTNPDCKNRKKEAIAQQVRQVVAQQFVNALNAQGVPTGMPSKEVPPIADAAADAEENYNDTRALIGQEALDYLRYQVKINDKMQTAFFHYLVSGRVTTYKGILKDDVDYDVVDTREVRWTGKPMTGLIEDCDSVTRCRRLTIAQIIAKYNKFMSPELIKTIEQLAKNGGSFNGFQSVGSQQDDNWNVHSYTFVGDTNSLDVYHTCWKTFVKVGYLKYIHPLTGEEAEMEVDDTYVLQPEKGDISIEWDWIDEWWEGYRIDRSLYFDAGDFADAPARCGQAQRQELNNNSVCKLPYNGTIYSFPSIVKQGLPYQALYNIFNFRYELTMARNKDKIMMFPLGLIPTKEGWDEDKFIYFAENSQFGFYDETAPNAAAAMQGMKVMDMSLAQYAAQMKEIIKGVKDEWWDSIGMNRQRYGDVMASDGKGNNEQAIFRSSVITDELYRQFRLFEESDLQGLIDVSKLAWINGKKGTYINSDKKVAFFEVESAEHLEADYGVFAVIDEKEENRMKQLQSLAQPFAQNAVTAPVVAEMIIANSTAKARSILHKGWRLEKEFEEQQADKNRQSQESIAQNTEKAAEIAAQTTKYKVDEDNKTKIKVAYVTALERAADSAQVSETDVNEVIDTLEANIDELTKMSSANRKSALTEKMATTAQANQSRAIAAKERDKEIDLKIAKENKNKYDK